MSLPKYIGSFPVTLKEVFESRIDGSRLYSRTQAFQNTGAIVYGAIGSSIVVDGLTYYESENSSSAKDGIVEVTRVFAYAPFNGDSVDLIIEFQCSATAREEPIASHPAFNVASAGFATSLVTASSGGAVFDEAGVFLGFNKDSANNLAGVASYLSPQVSFSLKYATNQRPSNNFLRKIGSIMTPNFVPQYSDNRSWLLADIQFTNRGNGSDGIYEISEVYRLSGDGGWSPAIYPEA